jgi:arylsulfatase A-like enzyme
MVSYKGVIPAGKVDNVHLVSNGLDLLPTLCDYAGVRKPQGLPGSSLAPLAAHRRAAWRDCVVAESQNGRMLRTDRYKYCIYDSGQHREQLIDTHSDPGEMRNLAEAGEAAHVLDDHRKRLGKWTTQVGDSIGARYVLTQ